MNSSKRTAFNTAVAIRLKMSGQLSLVVTSGPDSDKCFSVTEESLLGTDSSADIVMNDPLMSTKHARVYKERNWWFIQDLSSENGTFVNGRLITRTPLFPDSELLLGNTMLTVTYANAPEIETAIVRHSGEWVQLPRIIAHELKNYLQFLGAEIEQLKQESELTERYGGHIKSLELAGEKMDELVQMLRAGCVAPQLKTCNLTDVVWEQISLIETRSNSRNIKLNIRLPEGKVMVDIDSNQIGRAILNLLKNALEAVSDDGFIDISMTCRSDRSVILVVKDTGHGMDSETLASFWNPLFTTRPNGNGLGAFIARTAVLKHGGTIQAESKPQKGTVIRVELPGK